ncbi:MAG: TIGR00341 family protein, partial [Deltaproteobacteria bacterium]|nr:TIGR00341 family protein [Deltaproteobacteria bacterium]
NCFDLSPTLAAGIDLALQEDCGQSIDLVFCNDMMLLFKATMGRIPLLDTVGNVNRFQLLKKAVTQLIKIRLLPFKFTTTAGKTVATCACGCMVVQHHRGTLASKMIGYNCSSIDGNVSLLISAPFSIYSYLRFIARALFSTRQQERVPATTGYIESPQISIESGVELDVHIDGERATKTPISCRVEEKVVRVNLGARAREESLDQAEPGKEKVDTANLPRGKEVHKLQQKTLPFFSIATEDRFKELFIALRSDARIDNSYITLMLLSTLLATIGVYLNSPAVVIGAMLLAPLMAPIVSLAMGLLRGNDELAVNSLKKIGLGILLALGASSLLVLIFSYKPLTGEMIGRLNPSLLDLGVAVIAGIAAAYTKSFKEIMQGLAGVAIAVALVPPLAVAGIGLGRGDLHFFSQAFLLFMTNLVGIVLAALFTFRVLGFSPAVKARRGVLVVSLMLVLITVPLYYSYTRILYRYNAEKSWQV